MHGQRNIQTAFSSSNISVCKAVIPLCDRVIAI